MAETVTPATPNRDAALKKLSGLGQRFFQLIEFDESENLVLEIHKHPFGLFLIELGGFSVTALVTGLLFVGAIFWDDLGLTATSQTALFQTGLIIAGLIFGLLGMAITFVSALIYKNNVIFVTSEKIAQVLYTSLFDRKISQLSIGDVQDVTVTQKGIFARMFNFGTLVIETAGEQQNYKFTYVPSPYESAKSIVGAHEENLKHFGN